MFGREVFKHLSAWKADFVTSLERRKILTNYPAIIFFAWKKNQFTDNESAEYSVILGRQNERTACHANFP